MCQALGSAPAISPHQNDRSEFSIKKSENKGLQSKAAGSPPRAADGQIRAARA
jgi:hypothetical protein